MNNLPTDSINQMEEFLKSNDFIKMEITSKKDRYAFIQEVLIKTRYKKIKRKEKPKSTIKISRGSSYWYSLDFLRGG